MAKASRRLGTFELKTENIEIQNTFLLIKRQLIKLIAPKEGRRIIAVGTTVVRTLNRRLICSEITPMEVTDILFIQVINLNY